jgi:hypothetical protein
MLIAQAKADNETGRGHGTSAASYLKQFQPSTLHRPHQPVLFGFELI